MSDLTVNVKIERAENNVLIADFGENVRDFLSLFLCVHCPNCREFLVVKRIERTFDQVSECESCIEFRHACIVSCARDEVNVVMSDLGCTEEKVVLSVP